MHGYTTGLLCNSAQESIIGWKVENIITTHCNALIMNHESIMTLMRHTANAVIDGPMNCTFGAPIRRMCYVQNLSQYPSGVW